MADLATLRREEDAISARLTAVRTELDAFASREAHAQAQLALYERTVAANAPFRAHTEPTSEEGRRTTVEELADEENQLMRRAERVRREVEARGIRRELPLLDGIAIASPCSARWSDMKGDERVRHCSSCDKKVFNLSQMTQGEAIELLGTANEMCVRLFRRDDGTVITQDCPAGKRRRLLQRVGVGVAAVGILLAGGLAYLDMASKRVISESAQGAISELK